jgi:hypothetical protein
VDGDARQVEVWTPDDLFPRIERDGLTWRPAEIEPFVLELEELFRPAQEIVPARRCQPVLLPSAVPR